VHGEAGLLQQCGQAGPGVVVVLNYYGNTALPHLVLDSLVHFSARQIGRHNQMAFGGAEQLDGFNQR
jgi:hypothetical protein